MRLKGNWFRRRPSDEEMREELEAHVAMRAEHDGVDEAAARRRLGNVLHTRESMRRVWIAQWWDALRQDAHFTWRSSRQPGFALAVILVLGLGLGASTALFAALDRVLFRPLPYADPDRLVSVGLMTSGPFGSTAIMLDKAYVQVWDTPPPPFESVTATTGTDPCDIAEEQPEQVRCGRVEHNFLRVLGLSVVAGRDFAPESRPATPCLSISSSPYGLLEEFLRAAADRTEAGRAGGGDRLNATLNPHADVVVIGAGIEHASIRHTRP